MTNEIETELLAEIAICGRLLASARSLSDPASVEAATRLNAVSDRNTSRLYKSDLPAWLRVVISIDNAWLAGFARGGE